MPTIFNRLGVISPITLLSVFLIFIEPYDFASDITPLSIIAEPINSSEYDSISQNDTTTIENGLMNASYHTHHLNLRTRSIKSLASFSKALLAVVSLAGIAFLLVRCIRSIKPYTAVKFTRRLMNSGGNDCNNTQGNYGGGAAGGVPDVPEVPAGENIDETNQRVMEIAVQLYNVARDHPIPEDAVRGQFERVRQEWGVDMVQQAGHVASRRAPHPDRTPVGHLAMQGYVNTAIIPFVRSANPSLLRLAGAQASRILHHAAGELGLPQLRQLADETRYLFGTNTHQIDYTPYTATFDSIRNISENVRTPVQHAVVQIYDQLLPRLVVINNRTTLFFTRIIHALANISMDEYTDPAGDDGTR